MVIENLKQLEKAVKKESDRRLRIKGVPENCINVKTFLRLYFRELIDDDTVYKSSGKLQTVGHKRRSLGDIYRICETHCKKVDLAEIINYLHNVEKHNLRTSYCHTINKRVYYPKKWNTITPHAEVCDETKEDEYGLVFNDYKQIITTR
jgi:hypothetical protein